MAQLIPVGIRLAKKAFRKKKHAADDTAAIEANTPHDLRDTDDPTALSD